MAKNYLISKININSNAIEVCRILQEYGYQSYIVGGCVRDLLLGIKPKDWDICTDAIPEKVMEIFPKHYPTGLQHGTITIAMGEGIENHFEITTFRVEGKYIDGRRPEEVFFVKNIEEDLSRRDLTINAIAYDPIADKIIDPFNGMQDLNQEIIRAVGIPSARFQEDGLRIMRVARFAARFGYQVEDKTLYGIKMSLETLNKVSKERISDELSKILMTSHPSCGLQILSENGALDIVSPLLSGRQLPLLLLQDKCQGELETRLAFLYNKLNISKIQEELTNLKFSNKEIKRVIFLHQLFERYCEIEYIDSSFSYRGFISAIKNLSLDPWEYTMEQLIIFAEAMGKKPSSIFNKYKNEIVFSRKEMKISGEDLLQIGMVAGPKIKQVLDLCYKEIINIPKNNTKEYLINFARHQNID